VAGHLVRALADVNPVTAWLGHDLLGLLAVLTVLLGIAMGAVYRARDAEERTIRYQVFRDLIDLIRDLVRGQR
jgi:hypothetical protein